VSALGQGVPFESILLIEESFDGVVSVVELPQDVKNTPIKIAKIRFFIVYLFRICFSSKNEPIWAIPKYKAMGLHKEAIPLNIKIL
jgi:hypothetical protein